MLGTCLRIWCHVIEAEEAGGFRKQSRSEPISLLFNVECVNRATGKNLQMWSASTGVQVQSRYGLSGSSESRVSDAVGFRNNKVGRDVRSLQ